MSEPVWGRDGDAWERAWRVRYEHVTTTTPAPERGGGSRQSTGPRASLRYLLLATGLLATTVSAAALADTDDRKRRAGDATVTAARDGGDAIALGERNPGSGESSRKTAIVANAGNSGLVLRPSNTAKGGRAVSATCDNDRQAAEDGCAVYVNKGTGAAASFRTQGSVPFAIRDTNTGRVEHLNADMVDGRHATDFLTRGDAGSFLGASAKAADADLLDGQDSTAFLGASAKATDSNTLDGQDSTEFLGASAKATDSNTLDGKDSSEFLGATAKAADSETLDGLDSFAFTRFAGSVSSTGTVSGGSGFTVTKLGTGQYFVNFPAGSFPPGSGGSCTAPIAVAVPAISTLRFAIVASAQCSPSDASGGFTVETYNTAFAAADVAFNFMAY